MKVTSYCYVMRTKVYKGFKFVHESLHSADTVDIIKCLLKHKINSKYGLYRRGRYLHKEEVNQYVIFGAVYNSIDDPRYYLIITIEEIPKWS